MKDRHDRLSQWFSELREPLRRFVAGRRGTAPSDLDDVAQEVFLRLLRYDREELVTDPRGYLFKIAANVASEWSMRARQRMPHESECLDDLPDGTDIVGDLERAGSQRELHAALGKLPTRAREILRLHFGEDLSHTEISARLGVSRRVVKRDVIGAYASLRVALGAGCRSNAEPFNVEADSGHEP